MTAQELASAQAETTTALRTLVSWQVWNQGPQPVRPGPTEPERSMIVHELAEVVVTYARLRLTTEP